MATIIKPPTLVPRRVYHPSFFLAGSIEMGTAADWQSAVQDQLAGYDITIFSPRRDDWDSSWEQRVDHPEFYGQVMWELDALEKCEVIMMYFDPNTKSPISLLELGLYAREHKLIVCCPEGFWRKGNVDVVCRRYGVPQVKTLDEMVSRALMRVGLEIRRS